MAQKPMNLPPESEPKPQIATNREDNSVSKALQGFITGATSGLSGKVCLDIASAYFNTGGYDELCEALDGVDQVRLLLGTEPNEARTLRVLSGDGSEPKGLKGEIARIDHALEGLKHSLMLDLNLLGFTYENDCKVQRLLNWLDSNGKVEVRLLTKHFLHGKAYLLNTLDYGIMAGSSNFTRAGLTSNAELNLGNYDPHIVREAQKWFCEHWDNAEPYDLAALYKGRFESHTPQLIYLRMLWEWQNAALQENEEDSSLSLTGFQEDGLWRARRILEEFNGVLIADEVGLGKTFIAGELIVDATQKRRQRALVIAPATLRDGIWKAFKGEHNLNVELCSFNDLTGDNRLNPSGSNSGGPKLSAEPQDYSLIVLDEAHNARNYSTQQAYALRNLLAGTPRKQLVLLTATPVNNSLWDLYNLLNYFMLNDAILADIGISSLRDHFKWAMQQDPDNLTPQHLFDVLDPVTVRRTRRFIKQHYKGDSITIYGEKQNIEFPTPKTVRIDYNFDTVLPGFFQQLADALEPESVAKPSKNEGPSNKLALARYTPSRYLRNDEAITHEIQYAGLLRSTLLKRFESSPQAFANSCETMVKAHNVFLSMLERGFVITGEALSEWVATDSDDIDAVGKFFDHHSDVKEDANNYNVESLKADVENDRNLLQKFADEVRKITRADDPTLKAIVEKLAEIAEKAEAESLTEEDKCNRRKVLIFSYFTDTVDWVYEHLVEVVRNDARLSEYAGRVASISSKNSTSDGGAVSKEGVLWGFAPKTMRAPSGNDKDKYDIVVTTDILAEGVNLQQARHIINYDLPWNPMRLVQRHGRIDRIGSHHHEVFIHCVFPDKNLNELLGLEERIKRKLRQAAVAVGVESNVMPEEPGAEQVFTERREEIEKLRCEEAGLFEQRSSNSGTISGEEFRRELAEALQDPEIKRKITELPWCSGSGMITDSGSLPSTGKTGFVFCVRVGDHKKALFRYVEIDFDGNVLHNNANEVNDKPIGVLTNTLECLASARPANGHKTDRKLDEKTQQLVYNAWEAAVDDILSAWNRLSDPKEITRPIEKAQHDAINILQSRPPKNVDQASINKAIEKIEAPLAPNRVNVIRNTLQAYRDNPDDQAAGILRVIDELGLEPYKPPPPLAEIEKEDIHLICWLALTSPTKTSSLR